MNKTPDNQQAAETAAVEQTANQQTPAEAVDPITAARQEKRRAAARRRRRKKIIKWTVIGVILLALAGGIWFGVYKLFLEPDPVPPPQTTYSYRGSFSNSISGYGQVKANRTESVKAPVRGELLELLVAEGDTVYEGQELFRLDELSLQEQIAEKEKEIRSIEDAMTAAREGHQEDYQTLSKYDEQIAEINSKVAGRNLRAPFNGKLLEVAVKEGDVLSEGQTVGTIVRDEQMKLRCYFSYTYEDKISLGQSASVSIPSSMDVLSGKVTKIDKVRYVTDDGAVLFAVEVTMDNPGALTEGMEAVFTLDGGNITPAEAAKLEYSQTETLTAPARGKITKLNMTAYAEYKKGDALYTLSDDGYITDLETLEANSKSVRQRVNEFNESFAEQEQKLAKAQEEIDKLNGMFDKLSATAPMSGLVTAITAVVGQNLEAEAPVLAISDTSSMTVEIQLDERDVGSVAVGTPVNLTQDTSEGSQFYMGTVSSVALEGNYDWGYAYYPAVITIENGEGLRSNSSMRYDIVTSQAEDCVLVPVNAVKYTEIGACVFVKLQDGESVPDNAVELAEGVVPDGFYAVQVETGMADESQVEIVSGIVDGVELYVAEGMFDENGNPIMNGGGGVAVETFVG